MFQVFIFISHFLELHKEQEKTTKIPVFFVANFLPIRPFAFPFQRSYFKKSLLKTTFRHVLRHLYTVKQSCGKVPNRIHLKKKMGRCQG